MTVREWLHGRTPAAPPRLAARLEEVLVAADRDDASHAADACLDAAGALLADLLQRAPGREGALDLLTVDALVTYAFEAAADAPDTLADRARRAMARLGAA